MNTGLSMLPTSQKPSMSLTPFRRKPSKLPSDTLKQRGQPMPKSKLGVREKKPVIEVGSGNVFKDLGFSDDRAVNMFVRGQLALEIRDIIEKAGWSQRQA